jgi:BirA family biotin operon repressor/biotin-[acetyl-CoA-carboxylase] ligase
MIIDWQKPVHWFDSIDSTMIYAAKLAADNYPSGTVVGAEEQVAGHGRYGRKWHSEKGVGLYVSEILRLNVTPSDIPVVTLALGLATADAIQKTADIACDLRWPNDVIVAGKKCAGILAQLHETAIISGIGINVNHSAFPEDIRNLATSLKLATGREHNRERLLINLLRSVDTHCGILETQGRDAILRMFSRASSYVSGRRVYVDQNEMTLEGVTDGLDASGFLYLRTPDGQRRLILAGGVRPCS